MKGALYTPQLEVTGGYGQKIFSLAAGALPPGIALTSAGQFLGAASETGHYAFTVHVTDALGLVKDQEFTLNVSEPPQPLTITTYSLPSGGVGIGYSAGIGVSGGNGDYTFTGGGGIFSVSSTGGISGTPTEPGVYAVSVTVTDTAEGTASATFVISVAAPTLTVSSGDKQILKVGDTPEPVTVSVTGGGVGLAGVPVSMGTQSTTTDEGGSATFLPSALMTEGAHDFAVNAAGCGATVQMFAYTLPAGTGGTVPDILPGPAPEIPVRPVEDDDVIFESRSVSFTTGTLQAHYSGGMAVVYINGQFQTVFDGYHPPDYNSSKTIWSTSDGQSGEGTPPSLESLPWRPGLADGYDQKFPDTNEGPVDGPDLPGGEGGGTIWPDFGTAPFKIVYNGGYNGKSVGREVNTISEVRMRRKTVEEGGSGNTDEIIKALLDETTEVDENGTEKIVVAQMENFVLSANLIVAASTIIRPNATTNKAVGQALKEADIVPDAGMKGVIGDEVKSAKQGSTVKHFVTPQALPVSGGGPPNPQNPLESLYVVLKASGITAEQIGANKKYQWEGGDPFPNDPTKRLVKRDGAGPPTTVKIKKGTNTIAVMMVWVVWVELTADIAKNNKSKLFKQNGVSYPLGFQSKALTTDGTYISEFHIEWTGKINPPAITAPSYQKNVERPALEAQTRVNVPGDPNGVPDNASNKDFTQAGFSGWDMSRKITQRLYSSTNQNEPSLINSQDWMQKRIDYPTDDLEGNDDRINAQDEDSNPYSEDAGQIGELMQVDGPRRVFYGNELYGLPNTIQVHSQWWFKEFARVQIGGKWYRCSNLEPWRCDVWVINVGGIWYPKILDRDTPQMREYEFFELNNDGIPSP